MAITIILVMLFGTVFSYAAADPAVTIVSPAQTVYGDNLLVSIKVTAPKTIKVSVYEEKQKVGDTLVSIDPETTDLTKLTSGDITSVSIMTPETFVGTGTLQFYNKQIETVKPGLYRVKAEVINSAGEVTATNSTRIVVMEQKTNVASGSAIFETQESSVVQNLMQWFKNFFGN